MSPFFMRNGDAEPAASIRSVCRTSLKTEVVFTVDVDSSLPADQVSSPEM